jgi:glycosyltransferase involved in cell wall biosynthesis
MVTIGIPTYNRAAGHLCAALESALAQKYQPLEIIVSDNCSTDNTGEVIARYADPRIRYVRHDPGLGPLGNFNYCVEAAKGDYLLLLHDDDLIDPDMIETCMAAADYQSTYGVIRTGVRTIDNHGNVTYESTNRVSGLGVTDFFIGWFTGKTAIYFCNTLYNTRYLRELGGFAASYVHDGIAIARLAAVHPRVDVESIKASFRQHPEDQSTFAIKVKTWARDFRGLLDLMVELAPERKAEVFREGGRFMARLSFNRMRMQKSVFQKLMSRFWVIHTFGYRYWR